MRRAAFYRLRAPAILPPRCPSATTSRSILVIGSGPIVIGQACEFDYSGTQAVRALKREGYRVVLVNSNPATIMTDPELADATYVEPLTPEFLERIIERERPDAILPTVGGQTALNLALALAERGVLEKRSVQLIGANEHSDAAGRGPRALQEGDARDRRRGAALGPRALARARPRRSRQEIGLPRRRPALLHAGRLGRRRGAHAGGVPPDRRSTGSAESPTHEVLIEESVEGWKEFELEVMRDTADNVIIVCSIENFDAMGVHTGDSITVAPQMTLSDRQYQAMRDEAKAVIRKVGVDTGGSNIQFAVDPKTGRRVVIEMNPRVSRSSALASKATGFPIAKIAALLAVGLPPRRDPQRHHEEDAGLLRALARLRRRQDPALDLREVPARRPAPDDPDEVGRRGDGDRPHVRRGARQGDPLARDRARRPRRRPRAAAARRSCCAKLAEPTWPSGSSTCAARFVAGMTVERDRGAHAHRSVVPRRRAPDGRGRGARFAGRAARGRLARGAARRQAPRPLGPRARARDWARARPRSARAGRRSASCPSTRRSTPARPSSRRETPYFYSTYEDENESLRTDEAARSSILGGGPEPDRPGDRVRLLLRPRLLRALGGGLRDRHDQLQPRDGLDRLRHLRPPLLRAADLRGRLGGARQREARRRARAVRRPDAA